MKRSFTGLFLALGTLVGALSAAQTSVVEGVTLTSLERVQLRGMQLDGHFGAYARSSEGGHGWGCDTVVGAQERALTECNSRNLARASDRFGLPIYPCEVVWTKPAPANE